MKVLSSPAFAMQPPTRNVSAATPARATATPPTPASSARNGLLKVIEVRGTTTTTPIKLLDLLIRNHPGLRGDVYKELKDALILKLEQYADSTTHAHYSPTLGTIVASSGNGPETIFDAKTLTNLS
jgi:hypothetical protein